MSRIIPADAGSTSYTVSSPCGGTDHPRGCGEHRSRLYRGTYLQGSSPRMRGARRARPVAAAKVRIIPADAGSTERGERHFVRAEDHPRGCGEHFLADQEICLMEGSSPRMRGAPCQSGDFQERPRIIPADAGSTSRPGRRSLWGRDHPRGCGEHAGPGPPQQPGRGSSPRMRGALRACVVVKHVNGIIPADAGSTM